MIINKPKQQDRTVTAFYNLPIGTGFRWQDWYYIKIEDCYRFPNGGGEILRGNAVQLEIGMLAHFAKSDLVEKIPMSIEVLE